MYVSKIGKQLFEQFRTIVQMLANKQGIKSTIRINSENSEQYILFGFEHTNYFVELQIALNNHNEEVLLFILNKKVNNVDYLLTTHSFRLDYDKPSCKERWNGFERLSLMRLISLTILFYITTGNYYSLQNLGEFSLLSKQLHFNSIMILLNKYIEPLEQIECAVNLIKEQKLRDIKLQINILHKEIEFRKASGQKLSESIKISCDAVSNSFGLVSQEKHTCLIQEAKTKTELFGLSIKLIRDLIIRKKMLLEELKHILIT